MKKLKLAPLKNPVSATIRMPGSKSQTNRALIMAALTQGSVSLLDPLISDDTEAMIECLRTLGIAIATKANKIIVHGDIGCVKNKNYQLFARDSGTTARFMLALLCIVPGVKTLQGGKRLNERPIQDLVDALRGLGARIEYCGPENRLPVKITSSALSGSSVRLKSDTSSQFCSALLLISTALSNGLTLHTTTPSISKPYIDMTLSCMHEGGVDAVRQDEKTYFVPPHQRYQKKRYAIEGDFSSAGYFLAIAALTQSTITLENLNPSSAQPDRKFLDILIKMGNHAVFHENSICIQGKQILAQEIDMKDCPDQAMTMAVLAAFADGATHISGIRSLRVKETERAAALKNELRKMGIRTEDTHDTLTIHGGFPHAAEIDVYNDHRMAMAFAVAGMRLEGIVIRRPEVVNKTFPAFWDVLMSLE